MPTKAEKLLEEMRESQAKWRRRDLETLYTGFGFVIRKQKSRAPHDKVFHPEFPQLITSLPRHRKLSITYVKVAVALVDRLLVLQAKKKGGQ